jgi:hypothetical protein
MDRFGRVPVIAGAFVVGAVGCSLTALGCAADNAPLVIFGFIGIGAMNGGVLLARTAAADMYPPERKARAISYVLFGALFGAALGPLVFRPLFAGKDFELGTSSFPVRRGGDGARRPHPCAQHPPRSENDRPRAPGSRPCERRGRAAPRGPLRESCAVRACRPRSSPRWRASPSWRV